MPNILTAEPPIVEQPVYIVVEKSSAISGSLLDESNKCVANILCELGRLQETLQPSYVTITPIILEYNTSCVWPLGKTGCPLSKATWNGITPAGSSEIHKALSELKQSLDELRKKKVWRAPIIIHITQGQFSRDYREELDSLKRHYLYYRSAKIVFSLHDSLDKSVLTPLATHETYVLGTSDLNTFSSLLEQEIDRLKIEPDYYYLILSSDEIDELDGQGTDFVPTDSESPNFSQEPIELDWDDLDWDNFDDQESIESINTATPKVWGAIDTKKGTLNLLLGDNYIELSKLLNCGCCSKQDIFKLTCTKYPSQITKITNLSAQSFVIYREVEGYDTTVETGWGETEVRHICYPFDDNHPIQFTFKPTVTGETCLDMVIYPNKGILDHSYINTDKVRTVIPFLPGDSLTLTDEDRIYSCSTGECLFEYRHIIVFDDADW